MLGPVQPLQPQSSSATDGGWQTLTDASGQPFKNQGQCISYFDPITRSALADLAGSFSGHNVVHGWDRGLHLRRAGLRRHVSRKLRRGIGDASPGRMRQRYAPASTFTYTGTFAIANERWHACGQCSWTVYRAGQSPLPTDFELTLSVLSGTGAFGGTTGTIHVSMLWPPPFGPQVTGSVTVP